MNSNRKISRTFPSDASFIPDLPDTRNEAAYPSPPNSPREKKGDPCTVNENSGQTLCSSAAVSSAVTISSINSLAPLTPLTPEPYRSDDTVLLTPSILKNLFGINDWRCGGLTLERTPCNRYIAKNLRKGIDNHIDTIVVLHSSSPQFQLGLEKLVELVHCYQHSRGYVKQMRLDKWMEVLPSGPNPASHSSSIERKIELCFGRISNQCTGTTTENRRCKNPIGGQKAQNCTKTIEKISKAEVYSNETSLDYFLRLLATNRLCHIHTQQDSSEELKLWRERIEDVLERAGLVPDPLKQGSTTDEPQRQVSSTEPPANISTKQKDILSPTVLDKIQTPLPISVSSIENLITYWPDQYDTTAFDIVKRSDSPNDHKASYNGVRKLMMKQLSAKDQKNGYLYVYEVEENKGFVKIGYTTRSIRERHEEWDFDCNRKSNLLFPIPAIKVALVPNAHRVEKLCHAELKHRQTIIYCHSCFKTHEEWFESSPTEAIAVIEKWSAWMRKEPYHPDELLLKEEAPKASGMDKFMDALLIGVE